MPMIQTKTYLPIECGVDKMARIVFYFLYIDPGFTSYVQGGTFSSRIRTKSLIKKKKINPRKYQKIGYLTPHHSTRLLLCRDGGLKVHMFLLSPALCMYTLE